MVKVTMLKKITVIFLSLLLILSFAACGKDKDASSSDNSSSNNPSSTTSGDPTQDYDNEWDEGVLTDEEKEELEDLWSDITQGGAELEGTGASSDKETSSSNSSSDKNSSVTDSSVNSSSEDTSSNEDTNNEDEFSGTGTIGKVPNAIF